jgi:DNA-binding LacI/PurR family transcriptional regulator
MLVNRLAPHPTPRLEAAVNIGEVARLAGVSRSTVSYVLSGKRPVTEATRRRVLQVIEEVGYRPSAVARSLRTAETRTLGLVIPPLRHRLNAEQLFFVGAVADAAADHDYDVLLSPSGGDREAAFDKLVGERRVDGIVLMETGEHDDRAQKLAASQVPFVTIGRTGSDAHAWIDLDYAGLIGHGARRLHALGHRQVALINRPQELLDRGYGPAVRAHQGFRAACAELGLAGPSLCCDDLPAAGQRSVGQIFAAAPEVTAILTINEEALSGVVFALGERGWQVPGDVSVLAVASSRVATAVHPPVSSAEVPAEQMGRQAVEILLRLLAGPPAPLAHVLLSPPFEDRGSVAPPRGGHTGAPPRGERGPGARGGHAAAG